MFGYVRRTFKESHMNKDIDYIKSEKELLNRASSLSMEDFGLALTSDMTKEERRKIMRATRDALRAQSESKKHQTVEAVIAYQQPMSMAAY